MAEIPGESTSGHRFLAVADPLFRADDDAALRTTDQLVTGEAREVGTGRDGLVQELSP